MKTPAPDWQAAADVCGTVGSNTVQPISQKLITFMCVCMGITPNYHRAFQTAVKGRTGIYKNHCIAMETASSHSNKPSPLIKANTLTSSGKER